MGPTYYRYVPSKFCSPEERRIRWKTIAIVELKQAHRRTMEARIKFPLRKQFVMWWWAQFWRNRGWAAASVLKVCSVKWRLRGIKRRKGLSSGKSQRSATLNVSVTFFTRRDIWESVFKPAARLRGPSNYFGFLQYQECHSAAHAGIW